MRPHLARVPKEDDDECSLLDELDSFMLWLINLFVKPRIPCRLPGSRLLLEDIPSMRMMQMMASFGSRDEANPITEFRPTACTVLPTIEL